MAGKVRITNAALDERNGELVLRGVIDPLSLRNLQTPKYQREVLGEKKINELMQVHRTGRVADVDLNMRGERVQEEDGAFYLLDPVFIVDGLQRVTAGIRVMAADPPATPYIGATIYLGRDLAWERERFEALNLDRTKLSPNIHLRNQKEEVPAIAALFRLTHDASFVLRNRIQWGQAARKGELISATTYVKTVARLHGHLGSGRSNNVRAVATGVNRMMETISRPVFVGNAKLFFDMIEACWGLSNIAFREGAVVIKANFLAVLADVLSDHLEFWTDDRLTISAPLAKKLSTFKVNDPGIAQLASSSGTSAAMLYDYLLRHLNSGRRTPLQKRPKTMSPNGGTSRDEQS